MPDDKRNTPRSVPTPRSSPVVERRMPATDQDQPPRPRTNVHTKPRTAPRGYPVVEQEKEMQLTFDKEDRDRRRSESAGALASPQPAPRRAQSQHESWEDMHTPPTADQETWRAVRQVGIDIKELADDIAEQRVATMSMLTKLLDRLLEQKDVVVTSQVKVQETGALTTIHDKSEMEKLKRRIMWTWIGAGGVITALASALIGKYL